VTGEIFGGLHDFFHSTWWEGIRAGAAAFVVLFWFATAFWVWKDARRRIGNKALVALATLLGLVVPFVGPLIYMLFRPPEYLEDVRERQLEIRAIERRLETGPEMTCWVCNAEVQPEFLVCPVCTTRLRQACTTCSKPLEPAWQVCPYCETPVAGDAVPLRQPASRRPRQPRRSTSQP